MGNLASGKSALVHRYLTGTYVQEESPEGKRFTITSTVTVNMSGKYVEALKLSITPCTVFFSDLIYIHVPSNTTRQTLSHQV